MEESGRLQSMGSLGVRHDWTTSLSLFTFMHWRRKWQPTPVFLPVESQGRGAWLVAISGVTQSRTQLKQLSRSSSSRSVLIEKVVKRGSHPEWLLSFVFLLSLVILPFPLQNYFLFISFCLVQTLRFLLWRLVWYNLLYQKREILFWSWFL